MKLAPAASNRTVPRAPQSPRLLGVVVLLALAAGLASPLAARMRIRMGTIAPKDSIWHNALKQIDADWTRISDGEIDITIYPAGQLGDEPEMVRKVRQGTLQAVALSQVGLSHIDAGVSALHVPMLLESDAELDYVRHKLAPQLEKRLGEQGFVVLSWGDGGWVRFFSTKPARSPEDIRKMKLFTAAGDPEGERLWKEFGFNVVPLSITDLLLSLQRGMIDAFHVPPILALLNQSYTIANNMVDCKFSPVVAGTVISRETWEKIPAEMRPKLLESARQAGVQLQTEVRKLEQDAIDQMQKRGLKVIELTPDELKQWRTEAEKVYPSLRGRYAPADLVDEAIRLRDEYQAAHGGK
jgi:TRAP-type C4-dicarboxylate transport system substrate-binding protein